MDKLFFSLPGNEILTQSLAEKCGAVLGKLTIRSFPDKETYIRVESDVKEKQVILVCTLNYPDEKLLALYYLTHTVKELGAKSVCLVAPYLAYMRQDKRFQPGEAVTSTYFAKLISSFVDSLITIDPHLHRRSALGEIYTIPTTVLHAAPIVSNWIRDHVESPLLIGPDSESAQWVSDMADHTKAPFIILEKVRRGDHDVQVSDPQVHKYINHTPILVDDIISTAQTMIKTIAHLQKAGMKKPICIGVHGIFADQSLSNLWDAGAADIITCNTIPLLGPKPKVQKIIPQF